LGLTVLSGQHPDAPDQDQHGAILERLNSLADALSLRIATGPLSCHDTVKRAG